MNRLYQILLLCTFVAAPAWAQDADEPDAVEDMTAEEAAAEAEPEPEPEPEPEFDESGLDDQGFDNEDDDFDPSEDIPSDQSIDFPTDI